MAISSRNIFDYDSTLSKKKQLDSREFRIRMKERDLISEALMRRSSAPNEQQTALIRSQRFFELGFEEGFKRAQAGETEVPDLGGLFSLFAGALFRGNMRSDGGPVKKGEPYIVGEKGPELIVPSESGDVIPNDKVSPYFEASIGREDPLNLNSNIVTESFFDTGKGRSSDFYEEKTSDGKVLFSSNVEMTGSAIKESSYGSYGITETFDDGSAETFTETTKLTSRSVDIGIPDLIEHKDQLLGEIHKIKGFENVTIEDVIKGETGLDRDTLFDVLSNSDASYATAAKRQAAQEEDLKARGIKPGESYSTYGERANTDEWYLDEGDEVSQSLKGTVGYRQGQINPASLFNASSTLESESELKFNSEGIQPSKEESNQFASLASDINESVSGVKVKTVIQPIVQTIAQPVPSPFPVPIGVPSIKKMSASKLPNNIAKLIK